MLVDLDYKLGETIKSSAKLYTVIGFEWVEERGLRYILLHLKDGVCVWDYMYRFEIEAIKEK